jgi:hypothetical protein
MIVTVSGNIVVGQGPVDHRIERFGWGAVYTFPLGMAGPNDPPKPSQAWFHFPVAIERVQSPITLDSVRLCFRAQGAAVIEVNLWDGERSLASNTVLPTVGDHCDSKGGLLVDAVDKPQIENALGISVLAQGQWRDHIHFVSVRVSF